MNNESLKKILDKEKLIVLNHIERNTIMNKLNICQNNNIPKKTIKKNIPNRNSNLSETNLTYKNKKETLNDNLSLEIKMKRIIILYSSLNNISKETIFIKRANIYNNIYNSKNKKIFYHVLFLIFLFIVPIFSQINVTKENRNLNSYASEITIKINGIGNQSIISSSSYTLCPNEIYINDTKVGENICSVHLSNQETIIRMVWFNKLTYCDYMFRGLLNIKEIDLSKFDSSNVYSTYGMFMDCSSLEYINLTNFNTLKVTIMISMFQRCRKLKSLDITSFNTSRVTNMYHIFEDCNSLTSLDLSHFNTTLVQDLG